MPASGEAVHAEDQRGWLTYLLSPQVLLGGVLAWAASTGWDYWKDNKSETAKVLAEVREAMAPYIIPPPATVDTAGKSIEALKQIASVHENERAKDLVNTQIAHIYWVREDLRRAEQQEKEAAEKKRAAEEEARKAEEAKKRLEEAQAQRQAERAEELKRQEAAAAAAKRAAESAAAKAAETRIAARLAERAFERAPK